MAVKEKFVIFTYRNPRGRFCINFIGESGLPYCKFDAYGHYKELKVIRKVAKDSTAITLINRLAVEKGYEIAG